MTWKVSRSGVFKLIASIKVRVGGAWKTVNRISVYKTTGNPPVAGWRVSYISGVAPPPPPAPTPSPSPAPAVTLSVTISPSPASGVKKNSLPFPQTVTTGTIKASVSKGTGPYTYQWVLSAWTGSPAPTISAPHAASTTFSKVFSDYGSYTATFKCKVTDSKGNKGDASVNITFRISEPVDVDRSTL